MKIGDRITLVEGKSEINCSVFDIRGEIMYLRIPNGDIIERPLKHMNQTQSESKLPDENDKEKQIAHLTQKINKLEIKVNHLETELYRQLLYINRRIDNLRANSVSDQLSRFTINIGAIPSGSQATYAPSYEE
jgi:hypothetical protein